MKRRLEAVDAIRRLPVHTVLHLGRPPPPRGTYGMTSHRHQKALRASGVDRTRSHMPTHVPATHVGDNILVTTVCAQCLTQPHSALVHR